MNNEEIKPEDLKVEDAPMDKKESMELDIMTTRQPIPGMENFDPSDIEIPYIKLIQGNSDVKAGRPGQFINMTTNQVMDEKELILITYAKEEEEWEDQKTKMPILVTQYRFLALDPVTKHPVFFIARGTSFWPAKKLLNQFWQAGMPLWFSIVKLSSESKDNKAGLGKYYVMDMEVTQDTDDAMRNACYEFYNRFGNKMIKSSEAEDRKATEEEEINVNDII